TVTDTARGEARVGAASISGLSLPKAANNGDAIRLALRPESLRPDRRDGDQTLEARIASVNFLGAVIRIKLVIGDVPLSLDTFNDPTRPPPVAGETIKVHFAPQTVLA